MDDEECDSLDPSIDYGDEVEEEDSFAEERSTGAVDCIVESEEKEVFAVHECDDEVVLLLSEEDTMTAEVVSVVSKGETPVEVSDKGAQGTIVVEQGDPSPYARLFKDGGLEAMELCEPGQEASVLAGEAIAVEEEEWDKEIEDRIYPLDEVELKRRLKQNAEAQKEPSLEDMARFLG
ncbi:hypothetical protein PHYPSEUDO_015141 [Phytophthora pseudosyringae]|uniref:Uncharacterized protein n=1 Tax=Phytophthora pseudosyringae TaxID=221518 RepID=A0A8T1V463_9STRA|nr:hypothetical protein PHYPSEUDO_015141 [Phytophthora pseudosyringae]